LSTSLAGAREDVRGCSMVGGCGVVEECRRCGRGALTLGVSRLWIGTAQPRVAGEERQGAGAAAGRRHWAGVRLLDVVDDCERGAAGVSVRKTTSSGRS
jgi:hypothetical protein